MAPFSMQAMEQYVPRMQDIADQLISKWDRLNPGETVDLPADMTNLTLDTIALCGFGYRFNSFYRETPHPFVSAMIRTLLESQARARQMPIKTRLRMRAKRQLDDDQAYMEGLVDGLLRERREQGDAADNSDLLGRMLEGRDPHTGVGLDDENIRNQCITFLVAGHETTSGLLSFAIYFLLKNPDVVRRARAEVDEVLGGTLAPTYEQIHRLTYVTQVLNEALRLWPTAPGFNRVAREDTVIGEKYRLPTGTSVMVMSAALHRDQSVWGPDAAEYNPDHVAPDKISALPPNAYKPFGTGQRACIGRAFAMQEAILVLALLLQRFDFVDAFDYELKIKSTLTINPTRCGSRSFRDPIGTWTPRRVERPPSRRPRKWRRPSPRPTGTTPPYGCSTAPTSARPRASRPGWPKRGPNVATRWWWAPSMIMSATCRRTARASWSVRPTTARRRRTPSSSAPG